MPIKTLESRFREEQLSLGMFMPYLFSDLSKMVLEFNASLREEVENAKKRYNVRIRNAIAEKLALSFQHKSYHLDKSSIKIDIVDRIPVQLNEVFQKYSPEIIKLLLHYRSLKEAVSELKFQLNTYLTFIHYHSNEGSPEEIRRTIAHLEMLIGVVEISGILQEIKNIGPDILGGYYFHEKRIELYWLSIGLCHVIYGHRIDDFTIVVLMHELVHAYTHEGFDKDGYKWDTEDFKQTDLNIVEGFAQLYTEWICRDYFNHSEGAFESLLTVQSSEYTEYKKWFQKTDRNKYENARKILIETRKNGVKEYVDFKKRFGLNI